MKFHLLARLRKRLERRLDGSSTAVQEEKKVGDHTHASTEASSVNARLGASCTKPFRALDRQQRWDVVNEITHHHQQ